MPDGSYLLSGHDGPYAVERFACGAGPAGWRYVATRSRPGDGAPLGRLDLVLGSAGEALRVQVAAAGWQLRGGVVGPDVLWRRGDDERSERADGFAGSSPVWLLAAALRVAGRGPVRLRLVHLGDDALATSVVEQAWTPTDGGWLVDDLATGVRGRVEVAGDRVLHAPGVELL